MTILGRIPLQSLPFRVSSRPRCIYELYLEYICLKTNFEQKETTLTLFILSIYLLSISRLHHSTDQLRPQPKPHGFLILQRLVGCPKKIVSEHFTGTLQYPNSVSFKSHIQYPNTYMPWAPENMKNRGLGHLKNQGMYHRSL